MSDLPEITGSASITEEPDMVSATATVEALADFLIEEKPKLSREKAQKEARKLLSARPGAITMAETIEKYDRGIHVRKDDRAVGLVVGSIIEQALENAILTHCVQIEPSELFDHKEESVSLTFGNKINIGYALGVYGPNTKRDLNNIKLIRNIFAHTKIDVGFYSPEISVLCNHLSIIERISWGRFRGEKPSLARTKFTRAANVLFMYFRNTFQRRQRTFALHGSFYS